MLLITGADVLIHVLKIALMSAITDWLNRKAGPEIIPARCVYAGLERHAHVLTSPRMRCPPIECGDLFDLVSDQHLNFRVWLDSLLERAETLEYRLGQSCDRADSRVFNHHGYVVSVGQY